MNDLANPVTSKLVPTTKESKVGTNDKVIAPGMLRINPFKTSKEENFVPINKVRASVSINPIVVSQSHVITKKEVNSDSNGLSSTGVDNTTKTRRPQPRSNTKNDRVPFASISSCIKNKEVEVEEHLRNLLLSKNKKHMSFECNNSKLAIRNDKSKVVCAMCKQCLITSNHDVCMLNYVNDMNSCMNNLYATFSNTANKNKHKPKVKKPKKVGSKERLTSPEPNKPISCLRWSPTERMFDLKEKIIESSESESQSDNSKDSGCSKHMTRNLKLLINFVWKFLGMVHFGNDHIAVILGYGDIQWENILITRVYFVEGLGHNLFSVEKIKKASHPPKPVPNSKQRLHLLHMDLYGPMRVENIYGKWYALVIVDDYSRYTWVHFLVSKDEALEEIKTFLKKITVLLQALVIIDTGKLGGKGDIGFFISYSATSYAYKVYSRRTKKIMETMNVTFDELSALAF
ncbi:integrase, catalytic region, zinc finger, CCHC-type containing protein [Tanacetum coccineum]